MKKLVLVFFVFTAIQTWAQKSEVYTTADGAIGGYDPVAYFTESKPVKGKSTLTKEWNGEKWSFSTQKNLDLFSASPEKYAPQFGGYCAYGMSQGHKAKTDADAWTIVDGKLYLNYNTDVKGMWSKDRGALIEKANTVWPAIKSKE